jgi:hypothetical protein
LIGTDGGEWGGQVVWKSRRGPAEFLFGNGLTNVTGIEASSNGAVAVIREWGGGEALSPRDAEETTAPGPSDEIPETILVGGSYGFAAYLTRGDSGKWGMAGVARFPEEAYALKTIGLDLYAAWSAGYVVVFNTERILGLAACIP